MPSASEKQENKPSVQDENPLKEVLRYLNFRISHFEKKKERLDNLREDGKKGKELSEKQKSAVRDYDGIVLLIDLIHNLKTKVHNMGLEMINQAKENEKKEQQERQRREKQSFRELLYIQDILNNMGTDRARQDFLDGKNGAIQLTEEDLKRLDDMYTAISPSRDREESFKSQVKKAAYHLSCLLERREARFVGSTYQYMRNLLDQIRLSGYFGKSGGAERQEVRDSPVEEVAIAPAEPEPVLEEPKAPEVTSEVSIQPAEPSSTHEGEAYFANQGYLSQPALQQQQMIVNDLISDRPSISFLQDSELDMESPHMDPAVVAARAMVPGQSSLGGLPMSRSPPPSQTLPPPQLSQQPTDLVSSQIPTQTFTNQNISTLTTKVNVQSAATNPSESQQSPYLQQQQYSTGIGSTTENLGVSTLHGVGSYVSSSFGSQHSNGYGTELSSRISQQSQQQPQMFSSQKTQQSETSTFTSQPAASETKTFVSEEENWNVEESNTWTGSYNNDNLNGATRGRSSMGGRGGTRGRGRGMSNGYGGRWNGRGGGNYPNTGRGGFGGNYRGGSRGSSGGYRGSDRGSGTSRGGYRGTPGRGQRGGSGSVRGSFSR